ncbi:MAG: hypothetical protein AAGF89_05200 [Bacteroidota bacterium]
MDELERQIRQQRAELDTAEDWTPDAGWRVLEERLSGASAYRRRNWFRWGAAASILLACCLGVYFFSEVDTEIETTPSLVGITPEMAAQEKEYQQLIANKERLLELDKVDATSYAYFFEELHLLDSLQEEYLAELPRYGQNERLLSTLLRYYELKIRLLEQLENELEKQAYYGNSTPDQEI